MAEVKYDKGSGGPFINGCKYWKVDGYYHRLDGPAVEWEVGGKHWYENGLRHRTDGPAVEQADGSTYWYLNGRKATRYWLKADIVVGEKLDMGNNVGLVLKEVEIGMYLVLFGNNKIFVENTSLI